MTFCKELKAVAESEEKKLRYGFTTGSCAAAAAKAALLMLLGDGDIHNVTIITPKGIPYNAEIVDITRSGDGKEVSCAVIKDGGDDPDVTTGASVYAAVSLTDEEGIEILGGEGVGRVTKPGLDQPVGEAAINSVPRKMIRENLSEIILKAGLTGRGVRVTISVPGGEELALKTFNPRLGILGGISVLGTTGIVEPMSDKAVLDTVRTQIRVRKASGKDVLIAAPGNYGLKFLTDTYGTREEDVVLSSNFIYDTVQMAIDEGFEKILFAGHIGKLIKVAGGIRNTHSRYGDHRMEILNEIVKDNLPKALLPEYDSLKDRINECVTTEEAVRIIGEEGISEAVFEDMAERIKSNLEEWARGKISAQVIVFANENTELVATEQAHEWVKE